MSRNLATARTVASNRHVLSTYYPLRWGLVSYWGLSDLTDAYGANTLTNNNGVTFAAGKLGNAATLVAASSQSLGVASNTGLKFTGDCWGSCWVKLTDKAANYTLWSKTNLAGTVSEYALFYSATDDLFELNISNDGTAWTANVKASTFGSPTAGVWYNIVWYRDNVNGLVKIAVNGSVFNSASLPAGGVGATAGMAIGCFSTNSPAGFTNGAVDAVGWGKSPALGIAALATEIRDRLYNSGAGREFPWN